MLLLRDFGIKDKVRSVKSLYGVPGMEPEDEQKFREIVEKYEMKATIIEEYPAWLIDKMRNNIMNILHNMIMNITQANTIYPVCEMCLCLMEGRCEPLRLIQCSQEYG